MKRILLTGGSGFVGRNLTEYIKENLGGEMRPASRIILDTISTVTSTFESLYFEKDGEKYELCAPTSRQLNVLDEESVCEWLGSVRFDIVLHFAVYTDAVDKNKDGTKILDYNLRSFMIFYKYRNLCGRLFYSGSGAEYDKNYDITSAKEELLDDPDSVSSEVLNGSDVIQLIPTDPYGLMKYTCGRLIEQSDNVYNLRIFGLFGKYEYEFRFISDMCLRSLSGRPFEVRQNVVFDYLWIEDFVRMLMAVIFKDELKYHSYNMVSGQKYNLQQLCDMVNEAAVEYREQMLEDEDTDAKTKDKIMRLVKQPVIFAKDGMNNEYTASNERILEELGEFEYTDMQEAVNKLYFWYADEKRKDGSFVSLAI